MSESSTDPSGSRASPAGPYLPPHMRLLHNNNNPEQAPNSRSSASLRTPHKVLSGRLVSLQPKFSVTCFSARNALNADQPRTTTDRSSTSATTELALEDVLLKRFRSNQPSWVPESFQSDRLQIFLFDSRIPSPPSTMSSHGELGQRLEVNSTPLSPPPASSKSWSIPGAAITAAATDRPKVCGDWETSNYSDVLVRTLKQIADSTTRGSFSAVPLQRPRLKIEVRVAKCFFKHFVSGAAAAADWYKRGSSYDWTSSFSIQQLEEQFSSRQLHHQTITETTTMDNIARAQAYVRQAPHGFKELPGAPQSERKVVVHFHDTLSSNDTAMAITIRYPADDPKMMIEAGYAKEKDEGHETMEEEEQHHGLSEADHLAAGTEEDQQCANDIKLLPKFSVKHHRRTRECMVQFLREGRGADFRLAVITKNKVPQESSTSSDPAILEWVKQAWDSRTAGSLVFPANPRFKINLVRYKEIIHQYYSENSKVSMLKIRQVNEDQGGVASKVENHFEINLQCSQIEKHWIADLEEENLVAIGHMAYELVEEATKLTDAMGEVYIPY
ncbi:hypothetical protein BDL97_11G034900 [Sphagnum fallax]|nr:hypothetical protein BDL97_11G034900 [Sphagnum fallax]